MASLLVPRNNARNTREMEITAKQLLLVTLVSTLLGFPVTAIAFRTILRGTQGVYGGGINHGELDPPKRYILSDKVSRKTSARGPPVIYKFININVYKGTYYGTLGPDGHFNLHTIYSCGV